MKDSSSRTVLVPGCLPTYTLVCVHARVCVYVKQDSASLEDESESSLALLQSHIQWTVKFLNDAYLSSPDHAELAQAALANLAAWLSCFRIMEVLSLCCFTSPLRNLATVPHSTFRLTRKAPLSACYPSPSWTGLVPTI
jgi:hypothetical protein